MINNINNIVTLGVASGAIALVTFGGAVRNQLKLNSMRSEWDKVVNEPVPERFTNLLKELD